MQRRRGAILAPTPLHAPPRFLARVERTRMQFRPGKGIRLEDVKFELLDEDN
jgi:hypothetical protein